LGSPSAKSNPAQVRLRREFESGRWHGLSGVSRGVHDGLASPRASRPTHHRQTETDHRGREIASVGVGTPDPKREESHDFSRVEDVKNATATGKLQVGRFRLAISSYPSSKWGADSSEFVAHASPICPHSVSTEAENLYRLTV